MAFSDLCHITNAYQTVENETDQAENIMDDSFVRDLICNLLEEGPSSSDSSSIPPDNTINIPPSQYPRNDAGTSLLPPYNFSANPLPFNFTPNENGFSYMPNGFPNGFGSFPENDVNTLLGVDLPDTTETVSPEQLNLLRLAAQEIGGAQFQSPNNNYNFFEPNQRNSLPENINLFPNYNRPSSLNIDQNYNNFDAFNQRMPNNFKDNQDPSEILSYLTQLNMNLDRNREENTMNGMDFNKMPDLNGLNGFHPNEMNEHIMNQIFNGPFPPNRSEFFEMVGQNERPQMNFDFPNFKHGVNGFPQEFIRRDMNQMPNFPERNGFDNGREMQQMALMRQQELARQMSIFIRNRPPPNPLNVDVSYLHDANHFNMGLGALLGQSPSHPPPVLPSPGIDIPLLAPFYALRNIRNAATSSGVLHARLDACYEQWRQLERERKRTEARLALAYPGRAVSSSNSIPVPRLPPCPTRVDRLTVDMLREHTKVLTLMGKMETLRASVCAAQQKRTKPDENKITVLKRGQENVPGKDKELDPNAFDPITWRDDVKNLSEIAPHKEVELAMLSWRNAVASVQAARKREMHPASHAPRNNLNDPAILQLAEAVKHLSQSARRARCAMWCDLTLTVALAPNNQPYEHSQTESTATSVQTTPVKQATPEKAAGNTATSKPTASEAKEIKPTTDATTKAATSATSNATGTTANTTGTTANTTGTTSNATGTSSNATGTTSNATGTTSNATGTTTNATGTGGKEKRDRRQQNYKKHLPRNDFFRNQRYDARFMGRNPYHYLATGQLG